MPQGSASAAVAVVVLLLSAVGAMYWWFQWRLEGLSTREQALENHIATLEALWSITRGGPFEQSSVIQRALEVVAERALVDVAILFRLLENGDLELVGAAWGRLPWNLDRVPAELLRVGPSLLGNAVRQGTTTASRDDLGDVEILPGVRGERVLAAPAQEGGKLWGCLLVARSVPRAGGWSNSELRWFNQLADQLGLLVAAEGRADLVRRAEAYQTLARYRSEFLANVSHELRTPLGLIQGYSGTLLGVGDRLGSAERVEFLQVIQEESVRLGAMIDRLLEVSRIESDPSAVRPREVSMPELLRAEVERITGTVAPEPVELHIDTAEPIWCSLDPEWFPRVLDNLLENAYKYGQPPVVVQLHADAGAVRIAVEDHGRGVPPEDMPRIFERFYRGHQWRRSSVRGNGLGLAIARRVVEAHHGRIWAERPQTGGFRVVVELPRVKGGVGDGEGAQLGGDSGGRRRGQISSSS